MKKYFLFPFLLLLVGCSFRVPFTNINVDFSKEDSEILEPLLELEVDECEFDDSADCYGVFKSESDTTYEVEISNDSGFDVSLLSPADLKEEVEFLLENSAFSIEGIIDSADVANIQVIFNNEDADLNDVYTLKGFKSGDKKFKYNASVAFKNLASGLNTYKVLFTTTEGDVIKKVYNIKYEPVELTLDFVSPKSAMVKDILAGFTSLKYLDEYSDLKWTKIADVRGGNYSGYEFYHGVDFNGMGGMSRDILVSKNDKKVYLLNVNRSSDSNHYYGFEYKDLNFSQLYMPETITASGKNIKLTIDPMPAYQDFDSFERAKAFYSPELKADLYFRLSDGCIMAKRADGRAVIYNFDTSVFADSVATGSDVSSYKVVNLQVDGANIGGAYALASFGGCGAMDCYKIIPNLPANSVKVGEVKGLSVYKEIYSPQEIFNLDNQVVSFSNDRPLEALVTTNFLLGKKTFQQILNDDPILYIQDPFGRYLQATRQDYLPPAECGKPVIYLYPEKSQEVSVKVFPNGGFTKTIPSYNTGWNVFADTDSNLTNLVDQKVYPYLFWEGIAYEYNPPKAGYVLAPYELDERLNTILMEMGLNQKESDDFREFWVPEMLKVKAPFYKVSFLDQEVFEALAPLQVEPKPDSVLRIFMDYKPLKSFIELPEPKVEKFERKGFSVIEWGGAL